MGLSNDLAENPGDGSGSGKGSAWVWAQGLLILLYFLAPYLISLRLPRSLRMIGLPLLFYGVAMALPSILKLGRDLTPFPRPSPDAKLIRTGPYALVRNPIYSGLSALAFGYAFWLGDGARLIMAAVLLIFLDRKSTSEEKWLSNRFPEYNGYRARVRKLIPFLY